MTASAVISPAPASATRATAEGLYHICDTVATWRT